VSQGKKEEGKYGWEVRVKVAPEDVTHALETPRYCERPEN